MNINLEKIINYSFKDSALLTRALSHPSSGSDNYERLEFFGDSVIGFIIAEYLFKFFPDESEGHMAKRHASIVSGTTAVQIARAINLGDSLIMNKGEENSGGREIASNLEDCLEALVGAIYLDSGLEKTRDVVIKLWQDFLSLDTLPPKDAKSALQEWLQQNNQPLPKYETLRQEGDAHSPIFFMSLQVKDFGAVTAEGNSKKTTEQKLAQLMLNKIKNDKN
jgi:ribonuclease-3